MSDILYMYVFYVKNPSDVARTRFIAVLCLKLTPRENEKQEGAERRILKVNKMLRNCSSRNMFFFFSPTNTKELEAI